VKEPLSNEPFRTFQLSYENSGGTIGGVGVGLWASKRLGEEDTIITII